SRDWSSDVCSSDLTQRHRLTPRGHLSLNVRSRENRAMASQLATRMNVADRLAESARRDPERLAVVEEWGRGRQIAIGELDRDADQLARGLVELGVRPGMRLALLVKPGIDFVTLVFALLRSGATMVLVDGALGRENIVRCLAATEPEGFVAIGIGHLMRILKRREFPRAKFNVMVGSRWGWGGT